MSRYRKIDTAIHSDASYRSWSEDTKLAWLTVLTAPQMLPIPGVIVAGAASLGELLGWSAERFAERFAEPCRNGSAMVDFGARLVWLPKALKRNPPANPNAVIAWSKVWPEVPECDLKHELWLALKPFAERFGQPFAELFQEPCRNRSANQEQEQEQEQEDITPSPAAPASDMFAQSEQRPPSPRFDFETPYREHYPRKKGKAKGLAKLRKLVTTQAEFDRYVECLRWMHTAWSARGADKQFCPHFSTFVEGRLWLDEEWPAPLRHGPAREDDSHRPELRRLGPVA